MEQMWYPLTAWIAVALLASMIAIRIRISVALVEIFLGLVASNLVSMPALIASFGLLISFFGVKMITKVAALWPTGLLFKMPMGETNYTTCMISTGLTFGSISALYGLTCVYVTHSPYSLLVTAVIASAVIPTVIAQLWFQPREVGLKRDLDLAYYGSNDHFLHMPEE